MDVADDGARGDRGRALHAEQRDEDEEVLDAARAGWSQHADLAAVLEAAALAERRDERVEAAPARFEVSSSLGTKREDTAMEGSSCGGTTRRSMNPAHGQDGARAPAFTSATRARKESGASRVVSSDSTSSPWRARRAPSSTAPHCSSGKALNSKAPKRGKETFNVSFFSA